jgi:translation initiation factor IF-3
MVVNKGLRRKARRAHLRLADSPDITGSYGGGGGWFPGMFTGQKSGTLYHAYFYLWFSSMAMIPPRNFPPRRPRIRENVNEAIRVREVRAVFPDGSVEIMQTQAAIRRAQELGLDLILIAPTAEPPVAKAMDYGQWQYENKKKQHEAKRKQHVIQVKELKFRPNTDDHDYEFKKNHAIRFLGEGNRVKAVVQFRGREIAHVDLGKKLLVRFAQDLQAHGTVEAQPRLEGRNAHVIISPVKAVAKDHKDKAPHPPQSNPQQSPPAH